MPKMGWSIISSCIGGSLLIAILMLRLKVLLCRGEGLLMVDYERLMDYLCPILDRILPVDYHYDRTIWYDEVAHFMITDGFGAGWCCCFVDIDFSNDDTVVSSIKKLVDFADGYTYNGLIGK